MLAQAAGVDAPTQITVALLTVLAFGGAVVAAIVARRRPASSIDRTDAALLDVDLLGRTPPIDNAPLVLLFERVFLVILLGYAMFDRAFAWVHVPGTPLFIGEATLALGLLAYVSVRTPMRPAIRASSALALLGLWMAWGAVLLALNIGFGLDAIRDSALWYYGAVTFLTVFLLVRDPGRLGRWADAFTRVLPLLTIWLPIAIVLDILFGDGPPYVPDSTVSVFVHRFGNIAVMAGAILGFIWLVDRERGRLSPTQRVALSSVAVITIALVGFQNRGGMLSATVGIVMLIVFMRSRRGELVLAVGAVGILLASLAIVTNISIPIGAREISAAQMIDNIGSIIDPDSGGERQRSTTQWRLELWTAVIDDVVTEHPVSGFGPGPDLGERYGVAGSGGDEGLRNPHNSHLSVLARMGVVGAAIWVLLWMAWATQLLLLRSRLMMRGKRVEAGIVAWLLVFALMILTNAIFDPTLEGPQVGFWLWTVVGLGAGMTIIYADAASSAWRRVALGERSPDPVR